MKIRAVRDMHRGEYEVRFLLEDFTDDEIFILSRYGFPRVGLPNASYSIDLDKFARETFKFRDPLEAKSFIDQALKLVKEQLDFYVKSVDDYLGETVFEVKAGEEIKRISEGARRAVDKNSKEYKEVIEKNREAFEKLSKL
jgi:hypothetical protein